MTDDGVRLFLAAFDTDADSPLRDANRPLWTLVRNAGRVMAVPHDEWGKVSVQTAMRCYVRAVAAAVSQMFDGDGTYKGAK